MNERLLFSQRMRLSEIATAWCKEKGAKLNAFGIICALAAMGLLNDEKAREIIKEVENVRLDKGR